MSTRKYFWPDEAEEALYRLYARYEIVEEKDKLRLLDNLLGETTIYMTHYYPSLSDPNDIFKTSTRCEIREDVLNSVRLRTQEHEWLWLHGLIQVYLC